MFVSNQKPKKKKEKKSKKDKEKEKHQKKKDKKKAKEKRNEYEEADGITTPSKESLSQIEPPNEVKLPVSLIILSLKFKNIFFTCLDKMNLG